VEKELSAYIAEWLEGGKHRSLHLLAKSSGVSYTTVRRIAQGEGKPTFDNVMSLLKIIRDQDQMVAFLRKHYPENKTYIDLVARTRVTPSYEQALLDYEKFVIISLAASAEGVSADEVVSLLGKPAEAKLRELEEDELVEVVNGRHRSKEQNFASVDLENMKVQIGHCARMIRKEHRGQQKQFISITSEMVTEAGQRKIYDIIARAVSEVDAVIAQEKGSVPVFVGTLMGMFKGAGQ
jgi:DNA-binding phage protein